MRCDKRLRIVVTDWTKLSDPNGDTMEGSTQKSMRSLPVFSDN
jgi:hypothetical protein